MNAPWRTLAIVVVIAFALGVVVGRTMPRGAAAGSYADVSGQWCADNGGEFTPASDAFDLPSVCVIP